MDHPAINSNGYITPEAAVLRAVSLLLAAEDPDDLPRLDQVDLCQLADSWARVALVLTHTGAMYLGPSWVDEDRRSRFVSSEHTPHVHSWRPGPWTDAPEPD